MNTSVTRLVAVDGTSRAMFACKIMRTQNCSFQSLPMRAVQESREGRSKHPGNAATNALLR
eukprot:11214815-Lingulodinium_polyedra.AAC.1